MSEYTVPRLNSAHVACVTVLSAISGIRVAAPSLHESEQPFLSDVQFVISCEKLRSMLMFDITNDPFGRCFRCDCGSGVLHFDPPLRASTHGHTPSVIPIRTHHTVVAFLQRVPWLVQLGHMESKYPQGALAVLHVLLLQDGWKGGVDRPRWRSPLHHRSEFS